ncbi:MAG: hypothetical protein JWN04_4239 [Myxococcaceae bacterium]|nr:hypothetical protein [Myxococcaceae bacterium]
MTASPSSPSSARPYLRLLVAPREDLQQAWYTLADRDLRLFLLRQGHLLADPSLAHWVVEMCAELAWESRAGSADWSALSVGEVWQRLANLHRFFPQPRLVVAFYETLHMFLPWLTTQGRLERHTCLAMLDRLDRVRSPMLERAREQLALRLKFRERAR